MSELKEESKLEKEEKLLNDIANLLRGMTNDDLVTYYNLLKPEFKIPVMKRLFINWNDKDNGKSKEYFDIDTDYFLFQPTREFLHLGKFLKEEDKKYTFDKGTYSIGQAVSIYKIKISTSDDSVSVPNDFEKVLSTSDDPDKLQETSQGSLTGNESNSDTDRSGGKKRHKSHKKRTIRRKSKGRRNKRTRRTRKV